MLEFINELDRKWLLLINDHHNSFFDAIMWYASSDTGWIPLYILLVIFLFIKMKKKAWLAVAVVIPLIVASDQLASHLIKNLVERLRPSHTAGLENLLHYVNGYQGGPFGFVSSHACNVFALALYISLIMRSIVNWIPWVLFPWAIFVSYSRIYLGVHFPSDVICGAILGMLLAVIFARIFTLLSRKYFKATSL